MRFSYIDSEGKEIEVDSVESLALRIELGAIEPDTRMYDAVADRWAPAREHPVFRSLSRGEEVLEEDVVPIGEDDPDPAGGEAPEVAPGDESPEPEIEPGAPEPEPAEPPEPEIEPGESEPEPDESPEPPAEAPAAGSATGEQPVGEHAPDDPPSDDRPVGEQPPTPAEAGASGDSSDDTSQDEDASEDPLGLDFGVTMSEDAVEASGGTGVEEPARGEEAVTEAGAGEEAGDVTDDPEREEDGELPLLQEGPERPLDPNWTPVEDEPTEDEPTGDEPTGDEPAPTSPPPWAGDQDVLFSGEAPASGADAPPGPGDAGDAAESGGGSAPGFDGTMDDELPAWARETEEIGETGTGEPAPAGDEATRPPEERADRDPSPSPRAQEAGPSRPAHWERRSRSRAIRTRVLRVATVLLVLGAAGAGGAYLFLSGTAGGDGGSSTELPSLPPALHEALVETSTAAHEGVLADLAGVVGRQDVPERPPDGWLDGLYLSNAGRYPEVEEYWRAVQEAVRRARSREDGLYREHLDDRLQTRVGEGELSRAEGDRVREVAVAHYAASAPERDAAYEHLLDVARASLDLHRLLVEREADIVYEPYSSPGVSRDPVLEAVPSDAELRAEMNQRVDRVLDLMDDAEIPRPITTTGLVEHLVQELRAVDVVRETGSA